MRFCKRCNNGYEPDQQKTTNTSLYFVCKACKYENEETDISEFKISSETYNTTNKADINIMLAVEDITVPKRMMDCKNPNCNNKYITTIIQSTTLNVTYVCGKCKKYWNV
jgi:DNA-directed RNA polymerase subunit M/transcription elongation factor TFIIS